MTKKDLLFFIILFVWLISNFSVWFVLSGDYVLVSNVVFIFIMCILIITKNSNKKFNRWLKSDL
jgi:hypothetical protein